MGFLDDYLRARGISDPNAPLTLEQQELLKSDKVRLMEILGRHNQTQLTTFSDERQAYLKAQIDYTEAMLQSRDRLAETQGKDRRTILQVLQKERDSIRTNAVNLAKARSSADQAIVNQMLQLGANPGSPADQASAMWTALHDYFGDNPGISDPQILATIKAVARQHPHFLNYDQFVAGSFDSALPPGMAPSMKHQVKNTLRRALTVHTTQNDAQQVIEAHDQALDSAITQLQTDTLPDTDAQQILNGLIPLTDQRVAAESIVNGVDAAGAQKALQDFQKGDDLTERLHRMLDGTDEKEARLDSLRSRAIMNPAFRQWAEDHGYRIGEVIDGEYMRGSHDDMAFRHFNSQWKKGPGEYGALIRPGSGQIVAIEVPDPAGGAPQTILAERAKMSAYDAVKNPGSVAYIGEDGTLRTVSPISVTVLEDHDSDTPVTRQMVEAVRARRAAKLQDPAAATVADGALNETTTTRTVGGVEYRRADVADPLPSTTVRQTARGERFNERDEELVKERQNRADLTAARAALEEARDTARAADMALAEAQASGDREAISVARNAAFIARQAARKAVREHRRAVAPDARMRAHQEASGHRPQLDAEGEPLTGYTPPTGRTGTPDPGAQGAVLAAEQAQATARQRQEARRAAIHDLRRDGRAAMQAYQAAVEEYNTAMASGVDEAAAVAAYKNYLAAKSELESTREGIRSARESLQLDLRAGRADVLATGQDVRQARRGAGVSAALDERYPQSAPPAARPLPTPEAPPEVDGFRLVTLPEDSGYALVRVSGDKVEFVDVPVAEGRTFNPEAATEPVIRAILDSQEGEPGTATYDQLVPEYQLMLRRTGFTLPGDPVADPETLEAEAKGRLPDFGAAPGTPADAPPEHTNEAAQRVMSATRPPPRAPALGRGEALGASGEGVTSEASAPPATDTPLEALPDESAWDGIEAAPPKAESPAPETPAASTSSNPFEALRSAGGGGGTEEAEPEKAGDRLVRMLQSLPTSRAKRRRESRRE